MLTSKVVILPLFCLQAFPHAPPALLGGIYYYNFHLSKDKRGPVPQGVHTTRDTCFCNLDDGWRAFSQHWNDVQCNIPSFSIGVANNSKVSKFLCHHQQLCTCTLEAEVVYLHRPWCNIYPSIPCSHNKSYVQRVAIRNFITICIMEMVLFSVKKAETASEMPLNHLRRS